VVEEEEDIPRDGRQRRNSEGMAMVGHGHGEEHTRHYLQSLSTKSNHQLWSRKEETYMFYTHIPLLLT